MSDKMTIEKPGKDKEHKQWGDHSLAFLHNTLPEWDVNNNCQLQLISL